MKPTTATRILFMLEEQWPCPDHLSQIRKHISCVRACVRAYELHVTFPVLSQLGRLNYFQNDERDGFIPQSQRFPPLAGAPLQLEKLMVVLIS